MSKRVKQDATPTPSNADATDTGTGLLAADPPARVEPIDLAGGSAPTIEDRLAALERASSAKDTVIARQALVIAQGVRNAADLRKSRERCERLERAMEDAKKAASEAKKSYESAVQEHFDLETVLDDPQQQLPFPAEHEHEHGPVPIAPTPSAADPEADSWRAVILDTLGLAPGVIEKLFEANLCTVGDLQTFLEPSLSGYAKRLTDIPGIGAAKAEAIELALEQFWARRAPEEGEGDPPVDVNQELLDGVRETEAEGEGERAETGPDEDAYADRDWQDEEEL